MNLFFQHYPKEGEFEDSAYYWWYRYMQLVDGYGPKHPLWKDLGDVQMPFWDWWCAHGEDIFATGEKMGVAELVSEDDIQQARADGSYVVRIDPDCTRDYLMFYFKDFLDEKGISKTVGRRKHKYEIKFARYPFYKRPDVTSLKKALDAWQLRRDEPKASLYQIGVCQGLNYDAIVNEIHDTAKTKTGKRNVMNATVSRYLRWADNITANVGKGEFPNNTKQKPATNTPPEAAGM